MQKDAGSAATGLLERQCHFTTSRLAKEKSGKDSGGKAKESARAVLLKDQLTKLEEKHKAEMGILEDTQAFVKARGKLEMEYASNLQKLAQSYHNKRKWRVKMHKGSTYIRTLGDSDMECFTLPSLRGWMEHSYSHSHCSCSHLDCMLGPGSLWGVHLCR